MAVYLRLLADPHVRVDGKTLELPEGKSVALLVYLSLRQGWVSRAELAAFFRPDADETTARHYLRLMLSRVRHLPYLKDLEVTPQRLRWLVDNDVSRFHNALQMGNISEAIKIYERPLLQGLPATNLPEYDSWLELERQSLQTTYRKVVLEYTNSAIQPQQAVTLLKKILADDILAEDIVQRYMKLCYQLGDVGEALHVFEVFSQTLSLELGLQPLPETVKLAETIRTAQPVQQVQPSFAPLQQATLVPLVGRDDLLKQLKTTPKLVALIAGEPGIGKTRLLSEALPDALYLRSPEGLDNVPYYALVAHVRDHPEQLVKLSKYQHEFSRLLPDLSEKNVVDEALDKVRLLEAWKHYLTSFNKPVIFDDVQWADTSTLELLVYLAQQKTLKLFISYRSTEVNEVLAETLRALKQDALELNLKPLDEFALTHLVARLSNKDDAGLVQQLLSYTGGNPFFVIETLKSISDTAKGFDLPKAVADVVVRRVEKLSDVSVRVLQSAAVLGETLSPDLLAKLTGLSSWSVVEGLEEGEHAGILKGNTFSHDLMRQSIYTSLSSARRSLLHAQVANNLKGAEPSVVAKHYELAGDKEKAVAFYRKAIFKLERVGLYEEAVKLTEHLLTLSPTHRDYHLAALAAAYQLIGREDDAHTLSETLLGSDDPNAKTQALNTLAVLAFQKGQLHEASRLVEEAEALYQAANLDNETLHGEIASTHMLLSHSTGRYEETLALIETELQRKNISQATRLALLNDKAAVYDNIGKLAEATRLHWENVRVAKRLGSAHHYVNAVSNLMANLIDLGRPEEGLAEAVAAIARGYPKDSYLRNNTASAYRRLGRYDEAIALYKTLASGDDKNLSINAWSSLAKIYAILNDPPKLQEALEQALLSLTTTDHPLARARVCTAVLNYGSESQKTSIRPYLETLELKSLPPDAREELKPLFEAYHATLQQ